MVKVIDLIKKTRVLTGLRTDF